MLKFIKNALRRGWSPFVFGAAGYPRDISDKTAHDIGLPPHHLERLRTQWPSQHWHR